MPEQIQIPRTREEMTARLDGLEALLTASGWERAAIVYAFTRPGKRGPRAAENRETFNSESLSCEAFAALSIIGLTSNVTVLRHRTNWWNETKHAVKPGDTVELPTTPYPKEGGGRGFGDTSGRTAKTVAKQIKKVLEDRPDVKTLVENAFVQEAATDPNLAHRVHLVHQEHALPATEERLHQEILATQRMTREEEARLVRAQHQAQVQAVFGVAFAVRDLAIARSTTHPEQFLQAWRSLHYTEERGPLSDYLVQLADQLHRFAHEFREAEASRGFHLVGGRDVG